MKKAITMLGKNDMGIFNIRLDHALVCLIEENRFINFQDYETTSLNKLLSYYRVSCLLECTLNEITSLTLNLIGGELLVTR